MHKRGQAAFEFLITYGWAILAVLVALGAVSYYTGFYTKMLPNRCDISAPFSCVDHRVTADGVVTLGLHNGAGYDLEEVNVTVWCNQREADQVSATFALVKDQEDVNQTLVRLACPISGSSFKAQLFVDYAQSGSDVPHTVTGDIRTSVEPAAEAPGSVPGPAPPVKKLE